MTNLLRLSCLSSALTLCLVACTSDDTSGASGGGGASGAATSGAGGGSASNNATGSGGATRQTRSASGGSSSRDAGGGTGGATTSTTGDGGSTPPSCQASGAGVTDCGSDPESCCTSLLVKGGTYFRTFTHDGTGATKQADEATVSDFRLDKYLVTVGRYRRFVAAWDGGSGYLPPAGSGKHSHLSGGKGLEDSGAAGTYEAGWDTADSDNLGPTNDDLACSPDYQTWTSAEGDHETLPINCVNWWDAYAFCIWDGGFLPSEAEYQYAVVGGSEQREYPWGSDDPGTANRYAIFNCNYPDGSGTCNGLASIAPVGSATQGAGRFGQLDLVGELEQWNLDWFSPSYVTPCKDCAYLASGSGKVVRDGDFLGARSIMLPSYRNSFYPTNRFHTFGFRCARTP